MRETDSEPEITPPDFGRSWLRSGRAVPRLVLRPLERFLELEAGSASLLMAAAVAALAWSNVSTDSYEGFWSTSVTAEIGSLRLEEDLRHVVNDLLMAVFFYVVALEVKREVVFGSLRDRRTAAVPVAAALGTMVGAAFTYLAVNMGGGELSGWAIPIATDIAFALGVLGLAGRRAPRQLRAFMLTLAVVDDLGTILVIALFFSEELALVWLAGAGALTLAIVLAQRVGIRSQIAYVALAGLVWLAVFESGVHPTIAGVVLGFLTPALAFYPAQATGEIVGEQLSGAASSDTEIGQQTFLEASRLTREAVSPLARMESQLHPWSAYAILPLFALANAGVPVSFDALADALTGQVGVGIALGLVVGAPLGGLAFAWALVRVTSARLQEGLDWAAVSGVAPLKGIGFTVAIFISVLAFDDPRLQDEAKLAILAGSLIAGIIGLSVLLARHRVLRARNARAGLERG